MIEWKRLGIVVAVAACSVLVWVVICYGVVELCGLAIKHFKIH